MKRIGVFLLTASFLAFLGCDDTQAPDTSNPDFTVTVDQNPQGSMPTRYSWSVGPAFQVQVVRTSDRDTPVWRIETSNNGISSPVNHGTVPPGAVETAAAEKTLTSGVEYNVRVTRLDGSFGTTDFVAP